MMRSLAAVALLASLVALASGVVAAPKVQGACNTHTKYCGPGMAAICVCPDKDPAHCAWQCSATR